MAEIQNRPEIRTFPVQLGENVIEAQDISDVVKQVLWDMRDAHGWSWSELARQVGLKQQTLTEFMKSSDAESDGRPRKAGSMTLRTFTQVLAASSGNNPIAFFARHPLFRETAPAATLQPAETPSAGKRDPFERLRELLSVEQARSLCQLVEHLLSRGALDEMLSGLMRTAALPKQRARRMKNKNSG